MKNKAIDLHNHLFEQLEYLGDRSIKGDKLNEEIKRAEMMVKVASAIISNGHLTLKAAVAADGAVGKIKLPPVLLGE